MSEGLALALMFLPVVLLLIGAAVLGLLFVLRYVRAGAREPAGIQTPQPLAPRSPDGLYWWDGAAWRPVR